jgi:hypothetical protein
VFSAASAAAAHMFITAASATAPKSLIFIEKPHFWLGHFLYRKELIKTV